MQRLLKKIEKHYNNYPIGEENSADDIQNRVDYPAVVLPMPENENIVIEDLPDLEVQPTPKMKNCHC